MKEKEHSTEGLLVEMGFSVTAVLRLQLCLQNEFLPFLQGYQLQGGSSYGQLSISQSPVRIEHLRKQTAMAVQKHLAITQNLNFKGHFL